MFLNNNYNVLYANNKIQFMDNNSQKQANLTNILDKNDNYRLDNLSVQLKSLEISKNAQK